MLIPQRFRDLHPAHRIGFFAQPQARSMGAPLSKTHTFARFFCSQVVAEKPRQRYHTEARGRCTLRADGLHGSSSNETDP
jgi:hypothetical protein